MDETVEIIKCLISENQRLHETRCQRLSYLADLVSISRTGDRLLNVEFNPFMYGMFSEELREEFSKLESGLALSSKAIVAGDIVGVIYGESLSYDVSSDVESIIEDVIRISKDKSTKDLNDWSKSTELYNNTPFGSEVDFSRLDQDTAKKEVEKLVDDF